MKADLHGVFQSRVLGDRHRVLAAQRTGLPRS
jgi:hypothetical protein